MSNYMSTLFAGAILAALPLSATPISINASSSFVINFDGYYDASHITIPGLTGQLRVGQFREPFGMDEITSSRRARTFMEQPLTAVFDPSYNPGIQWSDALFGEPGKERLTYELGIFKTADDWPSSNDNVARGYGETVRVTGLPYYKEDGTSLLHVGLAYSHRNPNGQVLGWNARSESRLLVNRYANLDSAAGVFPPAPYRLRDARDLQPLGKQEEDHQRIERGGGGEGPYRRLEQHAPLPLLRDAHQPRQGDRQNEVGLDQDAERGRRHDHPAEPRHAVAVATGGQPDQRRLVLGHRGDERIDVQREIRPQ